MLKEDEHLCTEMELEHYYKHYKLQMELDKIWRQAQMDSDQAMMHVIAQVMSTIAAHKPPGFYAPPYPDQTVSLSSLPDESSLHTLSIAKHYGYRSAHLWTQWTY